VSLDTVGHVILGLLHCVLFIGDDNDHCYENGTVQYDRIAWNVSVKLNGVQAGSHASRHYTIIVHSLCNHLLLGKHSFTLHLSHIAKIRRFSILLTLTSLQRNLVAIANYRPLSSIRLYAFDVRLN
jgi:hypothetical protein